MAEVTGARGSRPRGSRSRSRGSQASKSTSSRSGVSSSERSTPRLLRRRLSLPPLPASPPLSPTQPPLLTRHLVIRQRLLRDAKLALFSGTVSVVALTGALGTGKTVLAAHLARDPEVRRGFPDGVLWLQSHQGMARAGIEALQNAVLAAVGAETLPERGHPGLHVRALATALAGKRVLLVLDGLWQREQLVAWPKTVKMLTTCASIAAVDIRAEVRVREVAVPELSGDQAVQLYHRVAGSKQSSSLPLLPSTLAMTVTVFAAMPAESRQLVLRKSTRWCEDVMKFSAGSASSASRKTAALLGIALEVCIGSLDKQLRRQLALLAAAWQRGGSVSASDCGGLWGITEPEAIRKVLDQLHAAGLIQLASEHHATLHDVTAQTLRRSGRYKRAQASVFNSSPAPAPLRLRVAKGLAKDISNVDSGAARRFFDHTKRATANLVRSRVLACFATSIEPEMQVVAAQCCAAFLDRRDVFAAVQADLGEAQERDDTWTRHVWDRLSRLMLPKYKCPCITRIVEAFVSSLFEKKRPVSTSVLQHLPMLRDAALRGAQTPGTDDVATAEVIAGLHCLELMPGFLAPHSDLVLRIVGRYTRGNEARVKVVVAAWRVVAALANTAEDWEQTVTAEQFAELIQPLSDLTGPQQIVQAKLDFLSNWTWERNDFLTEVYDAALIAALPTLVPALRSQIRFREDEIHYPGLPSQALEPLDHRLLTEYDVTGQDPEMPPTPAKDSEVSRRTAAATLDLLSDRFKVPMRTLLIPDLLDELEEDVDDWRTLEASILTLATLTGCDLLAEDMTRVMTVLLTKHMLHPVAEVCSYIYDVVVEESAPSSIATRRLGNMAIHRSSSLYVQTLAHLASLMFDSDEMVRYAAVSGLINVLEDAIRSGDGIAVAVHAMNDSSDLARIAATAFQVYDNRCASILCQLARLLVQSPHEPAGSVLVTGALAAFERLHLTYTPLLAELLEVVEYGPSIWYGNKVKGFIALFPVLLETLDRYLLVHEGHAKEVLSIAHRCEILEMIIDVLQIVPDRSVVISMLSSPAAVTILLRLIDLPPCLELHSPHITASYFLGLVQEARIAPLPEDHIHEVGMRVVTTVDMFSGIAANDGSPVSLLWNNMLYALTVIWDQPGARGRVRACAPLVLPLVMRLFGPEAGEVLGPGYLDGKDTIRGTVGGVFGVFALHCPELMVPVLPRIYATWCMAVGHVSDHGEHRRTLRGLLFLLRRIRPPLFEREPEVYAGPFLAAMAGCLSTDAKRLSPMICPTLRLFLRQINKPLNLYLDNLTDIAVIQRAMRDWSNA